MTDKEDLSGRRIGDFVLRELLGEGGFGAVYGCEQPMLGREAVVKVLHHWLRHRIVVTQRFTREAKLASRLDHPYAAHVYAFGIEEDGLLWLAMERVHGITLAKRLSTRGPMSLEQFVPFFERIAQVVQTAHESGIVHRDLKPSNVMVIERAGALLPKLLDFGVAKVLDGGVLAEGTLDTSDTYARPLEKLAGTAAVCAARVPDITTATGAPGDCRLTKHNQTVGSPPYISPEQWGNPTTVGPASDLYALAVMAFETLTGRRPFEAPTLADFAELHCSGKVPALGGTFPPALDRMFQRALAKRPEDRWGTALELADALRSASGLGTGRANLPTIDDGVRSWLDAAPQPLAELVAALDGAHNAYQARDAAQELVRHLLRYLLSVALATRPRAGDDDPALLELVRAMTNRNRDLSARERLQLLRLLVRAHSAHPIPELADLVTPGPDGTDALEPILDFYSITDHSVSEDSLRRRMRLLFPALNELLHKVTFLLDYVLIVPRNGAAERWTGRRQEHRVPVAVMGDELVDGHPMLVDRNGRICADLWPLVQTAPPSDGAEPELFVFDRRGRHGAELIARGVVHDDSATWTWIEKHLVTEVETKARMRDQIQTAARQWEDRARSNSLLWRGDVLADYERWTRHTAAAPLADPEASFITASRRAARRTRWLQGVLVAVGMATVLVGLQYRAVMQTRLVQEEAQQQRRAAEQLVTQAEVEQGRAALLHEESAEARLHLAEAYRRGDRSPSVAFMLARALQPGLAEQARLSSSSGRMWSAAFSPDGRRIVTTDDTCARVWNAQTNQLLFTLPHGVTVYHAVYSADGTRLVTGAADGAVRIWDAATGVLARELRQKRKDGKLSRYTVVAISPDGQVAAIDLDGVVAHVWDASTGTSLAELRNDAAAFSTLAFSADGRWLATTGGKDARVFETRTWTRVLIIAGPHIHTLSFDPTGPRLATGTADGDAAIWAIPSGVRIRHLREIGEPVDQIAFSPDGARLVTAIRDGVEQIWDARTGALQSQGNYLRSMVESIEFDATSQLVVAAGVSGAIAVTDATLGAPVVVLEGARGLVQVAHFDPSSRRVIGASWDGTVRVWDATSPYRRWSSPPIDTDCGVALSLDPDRRFIASTCRNHGTRIWDTARDQLLAALPSVTPVAGDFTSAFPAVSAVGDRAAIARGTAVEIYELPGGRLLRTISHVAPVTAVAFATMGHDLVSGCIDGSLQVTRDDREPMALPMPPSGVDAAAFLADGRVVATSGKRLRVFEPDGTMLADLTMPARVESLRASPDGLQAVAVSLHTRDAAISPVLWDLQRYRIIGQLEGHLGRVFSARFVAGGEILTAGGDATVRRWDGSTGHLRQTYRGGQRFMVDAALAPDGSLVVAGGGDGLLRFWDAASGRPLWTLPAHKSYVIGVHFEGEDIVTRGFAGDLSRWALPKPGAVIEACGHRHEACGIVPR
jgi:WD40 repeat protein/serine/threonine protein kinase